MSALPTLSNESSTTTTPHPIDYSTEWLLLGVLIAVATVLLVILLLLLYWSYCGKRGDYERFSDSKVGRGLRNLGNTCYFNSPIQALSSTPILKSQVNETVGKRGPLTDEFVRFLTPIEPRNVKVSSSLDPSPLYTAFCAKAKRFQGSQQHDSHEFLRHFLDQLRHEERASANLGKTPTVVDKIFGGHFMTVYICKQCGTPYHVCEPFLDISLPICRGDVSSSDKTEEKYTEDTKIDYASPYKEAVKAIMETLSVISRELPKEIHSIDDCLQYFTRRESLGQEYLCRGCEKEALSRNPDLSGNPPLTCATKQTLILNPPAILVIHLKRFKMTSPRFEKRTDKIEFKELLDIAPYCSAWCQRNEAREKNIWYSLYAVVVHSGNLERGHYVAYVKERRTENKGIEKFLQEGYFDKDVTAEQLVAMTTKLNQKEKPLVSTKVVAEKGSWFCMDDSRVSNISTKKVLSKEAFLLFYERISPIG